MNIDIAQVRQYLKNFDFGKLFIQELNWSHCGNRPIDLEIDGDIARITPLAELGGVVAYQVELLNRGEIPSPIIRRQIESKIKQMTHEHIIIFVDANKTKSVWQWVRRGSGYQTATREHTFYKNQPGDSLLIKLDGIAFDISERDSDGNVKVIKVVDRLKKAFDVEKVTRRFYDEFKTEHDVFRKFLKGIEDQEGQAWYVSIMLNRLMFIYFIQKKGFLNGDTSYLANKLKESRQRGADQFYKNFLTRLFFEGFAKEEKERSPEVNQLLGKVPYLNGGLFLPHQLEVAHGEKINITDHAFERLFDFFERYSWHLDYRPLKADNEINPDVLGYIFEKYINQKQMGAYYTKEDITDYICKNTIIPFLFDKLESMRYDELHPFPMKDVEPYIYAAVKTKEYLPTETEREYQARQKRYQQIKEDFTAGKIASINDLITYNLDIRKFAEDWAASIKDPVTLRAFYFYCLTKVTVLDPAAGSGAFLFAALNLLEPLYEVCLDKMEELGGPKYPDFAEELKRISQHPNRQYFILKSIIVNNLFGVDIMEEAVEICKLRLFLKLVAQVDDVSKIEPLPDIDFNIRAGNTLVGYTNLEQIRMVTRAGGAQGKMDIGGEIERIDRSAQAVDRAFQSFRALQTQIGIDSHELAQAKAGLKQDLGKLQDELNHYLAGEYGIDVKKPAAYEKWLATHQPFHWFLEFYGIMKDGGFDVIIGNPPYVAYGDVKSQYQIRDYKTESCRNLYAFMIERGLNIGMKCGRFGMIVPLSITFSGDFSQLRELLGSLACKWLTSFDNIPAAIFTGVSQRCTIILGAKENSGTSYTWTSSMYRWRSEYRDSLIPNVCFTKLPDSLGTVAEIPKLASPLQTEVYLHIVNCAKKSTIRYAYPDRLATLQFGFSQSARNFVSTFLEPPPTLDDGTLKTMVSAKIGYLPARNENTRFAMLSACAGELYFWCWLTRGDGFDVTSWIMSDYLYVLNVLNDDNYNLVSRLGQQIHERRFEALVFKRNAGKYVGNYNYRHFYQITRRSDLLILMSLGFHRKHAEDIFDFVQRVLSINESAGEKSIPQSVKNKFKPKPIAQTKEQELFDSIDMKLIEYYKYTHDELDFIINYDVKFRMGQDNDEEQE